MSLSSNWRIVLLTVLVVLSLLLIATKGLTYGIDFAGGTEMKMKLGEGGDAVIDTIVDILKNRLNGLGLKSTQVLKEADNQHIVVKVSTVVPEEVARVKDIINQQAIFEQMVEGELCASGSEIALDISQQGGSFISGEQWQVYVKTNGDGPERCGNVMKGKAGHMTDIFLDRPNKAFILVDSDTCGEMSNADFRSHGEDSGYTQLSFIEQRALVPVVCYSASAAPESNDTLLGELGLQANKTSETLSLADTIEEMGRLSGEGKKTIILMVNATSLPQELAGTISELNLTTKVYSREVYPVLHENPGEGSGDNSVSWIDTVTGLKSTLRISEGLTHGTPVYNSVFEGSSSSVDEAKSTAQEFRIWLTSGNLPVKISIVLERPNLPELGQQFFKYVGLMAVLAIGLVAAIISIRYRRPKLSMFILITSFSEIILILGFASMMSWELDMAAFAGIIAAIGTGVDHQIIITDEALRGERKKKEEREQGLWGIQQALGRAFFIIMTSVLTVVFAMFPLLSITDLRGFAFTTIVGVLIGLLVTRPAFARIVELYSDRL